MNLSTFVRRHRTLALAAITLFALLAGLTFSAAPSTPATAAGPANPKVKPITFGLFDGQLSNLKELKTTWFRTTAKWAEIEPTQGTYNFANLDAKVVPATKRGFQVVLAIHSNAPWGTVCGTASVFSAPKTSKINAFRNFVKAVAERYDGDGVADAPGLGTPVRHYQVENQWVTAVFYRDSSNCPGGAGAPPAPGGTGTFDAESIMGYDLGASGPPELTGNPTKAANEFVRQYKAVYTAARAANPQAVVGPGNIPTQTADAALFCQGKLGKTFVQNILKADGSIAETINWTKAQVCNKAGANTRNIKTWVRYWNVVLENVMPKLKGKVDYIDFAHYGRYQDTELRNAWAIERATGAWGYKRKPLLVAWEVAGPDRRVSIPGARPQREVALELPKRIAVAFGSGTSAVTWFHNAFNPHAAVGVRFTSLLDPAGKRTTTYWNYKLVVSHLDGAKSATLQHIDPTGPKGGAYLVRFAFADGHRVTIAWADAGKKVSIPVKSTSVDVIQAEGKRNPIAKKTSAPGKVLELKLTAVPVLIVD